MLQLGVYVQELLTALLQRGVVAVSESTRRQNPFVRRVICLGVDDQLFAPEPRTQRQTLAALCRHAGRPQARPLPAAVLRRRRAAGASDATLTIVGDQGPPCPGVTYRMGVTDVELASLYRRAWVYVTPSTYEGFGLPYLEAMACGTPVVATPNPGSVEMLDHGKYGVLAADEEFGDSISSLLSDAQARAALSARGLRRAREYSLSLMLDRYEALLFELVGTDATRVVSV